MKVFIWEDVEKCSNAYHENGGVVVFAETETRARELANQAGCEIKKDENPNEIRSVYSGSEKVYIMPNAGCC